MRRCLRRRITAAVALFMEASFIYRHNKLMHSWKAPPLELRPSRHSALTLSHYEFSHVFDRAAINNTDGTAAATVTTRSNSLELPLHQQRIWTTVNGSSSNNNDDGSPPVEEMWLLDPYTIQTGDGFTIPLLINKIFFQRGGGFPNADGMPKSLREAHESWGKMNPGYLVRYYDLDLARRYLHANFHPVFLRAFDCLAPFAAKSDLFRMALLYREGGWHSDWKQVCLLSQGLSDLTRVADFFAAGDIIGPRMQNGFVGARPRHPVVARTLWGILVNVRAMHYEGSALDATSTGVLAGAIREVEEGGGGVGNWAIGKMVCAGDGGPCYFSYHGRGIVQHKCTGCSHSQDWGPLGNNYLELHKQRKYYCEDANSLFRNTVVIS